MHGSVLHPALSRVRYVLARILHVLAICTTSFFCESQLAEPRLPHDYTISSLLLLPSEENFSSSDNNDIFFGAEPRGGGKEWKVAPRANGRGGIRRRNGKASSSWRVRELNYSACGSAMVSNGSQGPTGGFHGRFGRRRNNGRSKTAFSAPGRSPPARY